MRLPACLPACLALVLCASSAEALSLTPTSQIGASRISSAPEQWRVWARRSDGHLIARRDTTVAQGTFAWVDLGLCNNQQSVHSDGVSATWWTQAGQARERAAFIGAGGGVCTFAANAGVPWGWQTFSGPGAPLTGKVAITWSYKLDGTRRVHLFVTTTDGWLRVLTYDPDTLSGTWTAIESGISTTAPLAASSSPDGTYARVFAVKSATNKIWMERTTDGGVNWSGYDEGQPTAVPVCGTMAAAEGQVTTGGSYMLRLFCTQSGTATRYLWVGTLDSIGDTVISWTQLDLGAGETARNTGYAIAATRRAVGSYYAIDGYVVDTAGPDTKIFVERSGLSLVALQQLLVDLETTKRYGGMAATPTSLGYSFVFYTGQLGNAYRLYRGLGDPAQSSNWSWRNHQSADPWRVPVAVQSPGRAEGMLAFQRGKAALASIVRPGPDPEDNAYIEFRWSNDDGDNWNAPVAFNDANGLNNGMDYVSDPTVDFTDIGDGQKAYILMLGLNSADGFCGGGWTGGSVFYTATSDGVGFDPPVQIAATGGLGDHPWLGIYRNPAGPDRFHAVWIDDSYLYYSTKLGAGAWTAPLLIDAGGTNHPPTLTVGAGGVVYIFSGSWICRINSTFDGVESFGYLPPDRQSNWDFFLPIPGTNPPEVLRIGQPSIHASRADSNKLYYAFNALEDDGNDNDVFFAVITYDPLQASFTFGQRRRLTSDSAYNDDTDQFTPAVVLSGDTDSNPIIGVSWYDRRAGDGDCGGRVNRCFRTRSSVSTDGGVTFMPTGVVPIEWSSAVSDPALLPWHCGEPGVRFHGDYHETSEDKLHAAHLVSGVPWGSNPESSGFAMGWFSGGYYLWPSP